MDTVQNNSQIEVSAVLGCYTVLIGTNQYCASLQNPEIMNSKIYRISEVVLYVAECDRVPSTGNIAVSEKEDQPQPTSHHCQAVCSEKRIVVTSVIDCNYSKESSARTSGEVRLGKEETHCSVKQSLSVEEHTKVTVNVETETQCDISETETTSPVDSHSPLPPLSPTVQHRIKPQVMESLQLVQRSEVILRVNAATSDAASQTESEREVLEVVSPLVRQKLQEEIECEKLSLDLASHLPPSDKLQGLLGMNLYFFSVKYIHAQTHMHAYTYTWAIRQWLISDKNSAHQTFLYNRIYALQHCHWCPVSVCIPSNDVTRETLSAHTIVNAPQQHSYHHITCEM